MSEKHGLSERTLEAIHSVLARHVEVEQAVLFGSRAKGTQRRGSDIDLVLKGPGISFGLVNRIYSELDDLPIPYEFSLVTEEEMTNPEFRAHVERVGLLFYERNAAAAT
jgi:predicted nucleotidyltransferase